MNLKNSYEILPHPAELKIRIYGGTLEEMFKNAALAMGDILKHNANAAKKYANVAKKEIIKVESVDINSLLADFLSEILARSQINKCVYLVSDIKIDASHFMLRAPCFGYPVKRFDEDVKAVTYEDLDIKKIDDIWQTDLVFDI